MRISVSAIAALVMAATTAAAAQEPSADDRVSAGKLVAERHCAQCHAIEAGATSPLADAPPIPELYRRFPVERMAEALENGMLNDHPRMPQFRLEADERAALTAYLSSFQPAPRPRPPRRVRPLPRPGGLTALRLSRPAAS